MDSDAFDEAFFERLEAEEGVEDFFRDRAVSFEVFFVVMSALYHDAKSKNRVEFTTLIVFVGHLKSFKVSSI